MNLRRWLQPGIGVKRWLLVVFAGELCLALAGALVLRQVYREVEVDGPVQAALYLVTLQFLPYAARGAILAGLGVGLFVWGSYRVVRALTEPFTTGAETPLVEVIYQKRLLSRGPRVVAIGGGTGLSTLLRGLKERTSNLTAIVTVADDGGSSGKLREVLGIPPVGDIRNCIVALADAEPLMGELLQYRFPRRADGGDGPKLDPGAGPDGAPSTRPDRPTSSDRARPIDPDRPASADADRAAPAHPIDPDRPASSSPDASTDLPSSPDEADRLHGHAVGNLLIAAMAAIQGGDFEEAVRQMNRVLLVRGRVLPATPTPLTLHARLADGTVVDGQSRIARSSGIERVWITPPDVKASDDALAAIGEADILVIGPGSLFTSILPSLLIPDIQAAVAASPAVRIYVCNVATQYGETAGFDLADHVEALERHTRPGLVDVVLANSAFGARRPAEWRAEPVRLRWPPATGVVPELVLDEVVDPANAHHHDPERLAAAVFRVAERTSQRRRREGPQARAARTA